MSVIILTTLVSVFLAIMVRVPTKGILSRSNNCIIIKSTRVVIAFFTIWVITCFRWSTDPDADTTYLTGSYWLYYKNCFNDKATIIALLTGGEPLVWLIIKLFAFLKIGWFNILLIFSTIYILSFGYFFLKNCSFISIAIIFYCFLGLFLFPFSALRQALGQSFVLIAYNIMLNSKSKRKTVKACLVLILGAFAHSTCIMLLPFLILANKKYELTKLYLIVFLLIILSYVLGPFIRNLICLFKESYSNRLENEQFGFTITFVLLSSLNVFLCVISAKKMYNKEYLCMNLILFYAIVSFYSSSLIDPYRILHLFSPIMILFFDRLLRVVKDSFSKILLLVFYAIACCIIFVKQTGNYVYTSALPELEMILQL